MVVDKAEFRSLSIKADLVAEIQNFITRNKRYRSVAEFISEAIRLRLEDLQKGTSSDAEK